MNALTEPTDGTEGLACGGPCVVLTINKQPGADTRAVTDNVFKAIEELSASLPKDIQVIPLYSQKSFIDRAIENVVDALRDGVILVIIILVLFLMNVRTTFITLTAIPLSLVITALVFAISGMSINTMTLGGLAVALGELVDDAIVDVENIFRRLNENRHCREAETSTAGRLSGEHRSSQLDRLQHDHRVHRLHSAVRSDRHGRHACSLRWASPTSFRLRRRCWCRSQSRRFCRTCCWGGRRHLEHAADGFVLRFLKAVASQVIRFSLTFPRLNLTVVVIGVLISAVFVLNLERDFLPPFNEGSIQLNVVLPPGTSLTVSNSIAAKCERRLMQVPDVVRVGRRTGRAELDEHAEGVNTSELIIDLNPSSHRTREEQINEIREAMADIPGVVSAVEQPISHLISHMLSGVKAQIGIKIYGDDLDLLRRKAQEMEQAVKSVPGVADLMLEPQVLIPQLRIELRRDKLALNGLTARDVNQVIETALNGVVVSEVLDGQRTFDLVVRFDKQDRENLDVLRRLSIELPEGGTRSAGISRQHL